MEENAFTQSELHSSSSIINKNFNYITDSAKNFENKKFKKHFLRYLKRVQVIFQTKEF